MENTYDKIYGCFKNTHYYMSGSTKPIGKGIPAARGRSDLKRFSQRPMPSINY